MRMLTASASLIFLLNDISIFKIVKLKTGYGDECFVHLLDPLLAL